LIFNKLK